MAKKKNGPNKSQAIRDVLAVDPKADFKTVQAKLAESGIKIGNALFYMVKSKAGKAKRRATREKAASLSGGMAVQNPIAMLKKLKGLADEVGGMKNLLQIVTLLAE
jgi:hypothetical protein